MESRSPGYLGLSGGGLFPWNATEEEAVSWPVMTAHSRLMWPATFSSLLYSPPLSQLNCSLFPCQRECERFFNSFLKSPQIIISFIFFYPPHTCPLLTPPFCFIHLIKFSNENKVFVCFFSFFFLCKTRVPELKMNKNVYLV